MRAPALLLLLLAPLAAAQVPDLSLVELTVDTPAAVRPLQGAVTANVTLRVSCALAAEPPGAPVTYAVDAAPAWAVVVVSPATDVVDPASCQGGHATRNATLSITASDQAPAFRPAPIRLVATVGGSSRQQSDSAETNVTADAFSILDVAAIESQKNARPGEQVAFPVKVTNLGNARTRVHFMVENATEGITVTPVDSLVLDAKQQGANRISADVGFLVRARDAGGFVNRVDTFTVLLRAEHADEPPRAGDESRLTFILNTRTDFGLRSESPGPGLALVAAGLVLAAYATRRV